MDENEESRAGAYSLKQILTTEKGILHLGPTRAVVMTESAFVFLLRVLHENAPHILKYALYDMGYRAGNQMASARPSQSETPEESFHLLVETYKQAGYGNLEVLEYDLSVPRARLRGTHLLESSAACEADIYRSPRAVDHYTRGMLAGLMSNTLGHQVVCEEIACEFRGDPACEFVILPFGGEE
ncbi:MAG: hypothetical protein EPO21_09440 [Chloroflexota bacterium]|nr:MAG: hypothetical protein EPO21_09440 [Chloroflexota bacterium]